MTDSMTESSIPRCLCGLEAAVRRNKSREYYGCPKESMDPTSCSFISWCKQAAQGGGEPVSRNVVVEGEGEHSGIPVSDGGSDIPGKPKEYNKHAICFQCGGHGHVAKDCPLMEQKDDDAPAQVATTQSKNGPIGTCFYCKETGHFVAECPKKQKDILARKTCFRCRQVGHWASDCPTKKKKSTPKASTPQILPEPEKPVAPPEKTTPAGSSSGKRKSTDAIDMPPPKSPLVCLVRQTLPSNIDVRKLPLSMRGGGSYTRP